MVFYMAYTARAVQLASASLFEIQKGVGRGKLRGDSNERAEGDEDEWGEGKH